MDDLSATDDFTTEAMNLTKLNGPWVMYAERSGTDGAPKVTLQISRDGKAWSDYTVDATLVPLPASFSQSVFYPKFMRVVYVANSATGKVTFKFQEVK